MRMLDDTDTRKHVNAEQYCTKFTETLGIPITVRYCGPTTEDAIDPLREMPSTVKEAEGAMSSPGNSQAKEPQRIGNSGDSNPSFYRPLAAAVARDVGVSGCEDRAGREERPS